MIPVDALSSDARRLSDDGAATCRQAAQGGMASELTRHAFLVSGLVDRYIINERRQRLQNKTLGVSTPVSALHAVVQMG